MSPSRDGSVRSQRNRRRCGNSDRSPRHRPSRGLSDRRSANGGVASAAARGPDQPSANGESRGRHTADGAAAPPAGLGVRGRSGRPRRCATSSSTQRAPWSTAASTSPTHSAAGIDHQPPYPKTPPARPDGRWRTDPRAAPGWHRSRPGRPCTPATAPPATACSAAAERWPPAPGRAPTERRRRRRRAAARSTGRANADTHAPAAPARHWRRSRTPARSAADARRARTPGRRRARPRERITARRSAPARINRHDTAEAQSRGRPRDPAQKAAGGAEPVGSFGSPGLPAQGISVSA